MKKLIGKLLLYILPFVLVLGLFLCFEPYDYFGLRGSSTYLSKPLSSVRELLRERPANIILGDSRMANLNTDYIEALTGERYAMLGFGGAQTGELIELFWYAAEHTQLEKVVFGIGFYTSGGEQGKGRIPAVLETAGDAGKFLLNPNYWLDALNAAKLQAVNLAAGLLGRDDLLEYPEDPTDYTQPQQLPQERGETYRKDLEDYCALLRGNLGDGYFVSDELLAQLGAMIDYCDENGIEIVFVYPPMQECVFELVVDELGIAGEIAKYKAFLAARAPVWDMEFLNGFTCDESNFYDGFHLANAKKQLLAELLFTDTGSEYIVRTAPDGKAASAWS